jgi:hypothetical protein
MLAGRWKRSYSVGMRLLAWREQINAEAKPSNTVVALRNGRFVSIYYQRPAAIGLPPTRTSPYGSRPRQASRGPAMMH